VAGNGQERGKNRKPVGTHEVNTELSLFEWNEALNGELNYASLKYQLGPRCFS